MNQLSPQDRHTLDNYRGLSVGQIFRRARGDLGYDIMDIAAHLNIASTHLEAIEADDINSLPPKVYAVGFVRAYADLLSLDSEKMAYLFKVQFYGKRQTEERKTIIRPEGKTLSIHDTLAQKDFVIPKIITALLLACVGCVLFIAFIVWMFLPSDNSKDIVVPEVPAEMTEEQTVEIDDFVETENTDAPPPIEPIDLVVQPDGGATAYGADPYEAALAFKMADKSWLEIRDLKTGDILLTRTLKKGDAFYSTEDQDVLLTTGNAGGVEVFLDGQSLGLLGDKAEVLRSRPFSVEALRLQQAN